MRTYYLIAMRKGDLTTAQYYWQKIQDYDEALRLLGKEAAKMTLPTRRARRSGGRVDLSQQYLDAVRAGDDELAAKLQRRIANRDKSGMVDHLVREFRTLLAGLR
jgi:hypothetical protein